MTPETLARLRAIDDNITFVLVHIKHRRLKHFENDIALRYACQYALVIITEATRNLPSDLRAQAPHMSWDTIIPLGDSSLLTSEHPDPSLVWNVITGDLPTLHIAVRNFLDSETMPV